MQDPTPDLERSLEPTVAQLCPTPGSTISGGGYIMWTDTRMLHALHDGISRTSLSILYSLNSVFFLSCHPSIHPSTLALLTTIFIIISVHHFPETYLHTNTKHHTASRQTPIPSHLPPSQPRPAPSSTSTCATAAARATCPLTLFTHALSSAFSPIFLGQMQSFLPSFLPAHGPDYDAHHLSARPLTKQDPSVD